MVCHQAVLAVANVHHALAVNDIGQAARCLDMPLGIDRGRELGNLPYCDHLDDILLVALIHDIGGLVGIDLVLCWERPNYYWR